MDASTAGANLAEAIARSRPQTAARLKYGTVMQVRDGSLLVSVDGGSATARRVTRWPYEVGETVVLLAQGRVLQALLPTTASGVDEERMQQVEAAASDAQETAASANTAAQEAQASAASAQSAANGAASTAAQAQEAAEFAQGTATSAQTTAQAAQSAASAAATTASAAQTAADAAQTTANAASTTATQAQGTAAAAQTAATVAQTTANAASTAAQAAQSTADAANVKSVHATCSTAAGTAAKVATITPTVSGFTLTNGRKVSVYFSAANTAATPTLNVNSTGAKAIRPANGTDFTSATHSWAAGQVVELVYNGTYWLMVDGNALAKAGAAQSAATSAGTAATAAQTAATTAQATANTANAAAQAAQTTADDAQTAATAAQTTANAANVRSVHATCSTAAGTAAKVATITPTVTGFTLVNGRKVSVYFTYANSAATPTLNVNSTGAKAIRPANGTAFTSATHSWAAGQVVELVYNGTYWLMVDGNALAKADAAQTAANNAAKTATNYLSYTSGTGLVVGDMTAGTLGGNTLITASDMKIRKGTTVLATFGASTVELGKNSANSVIEMCGGKGSIRSVTNQLRVSGDAGAYFGPADITNQMGIGILPDGTSWKIYGDAAHIEFGGYKTNCGVIGPTKLLFRLNGAGSNLDIGCQYFVNPYGLVFIGVNGNYTFPSLSAWSHYDAVSALPVAARPPIMVYAQFPMGGGSVAIQVSESGAVSLIWMSAASAATFPASMTYPSAGNV